ncbi:glycosyltransferase family protein [Vreelandella piezotolerans]|uniref:hypothetical protein n=1 Tax=Vreelandella piezotolerans TaxID=2609667 RepID=UPI0037B653C4
MGTVCFIVDASVTGALLPRHLRSIRQSGLADHALPIIVTCAHSDERLTDLEKRYHAHGLVTPAHTLGARLNQAAYISQADWLLIALHKEPMAAQLWYLLYPQLDTATDALLINAATPRFSERLLLHFLSSGVTVPPYIAIRRAWLERIGGFDPELDEPALLDFLQRLYACPTRLKTLSGESLGLARGSPHSRSPTSS